MPINFTKDQQSIIDIRGKNLLVSAAAGSGKTAVLVERIIKMVSDTETCIDIDRLLVLTFTNLAAGEMRERIGRAISQNLEHNPENAHLQRQMTLLHNAQITTIDSFCLFILRNHFHAIGLDPGFRVADEGELKLLKKDVMTELLEEWYELKTPEFLACADYFTIGLSDTVIEEYIEKLYDMAISFPWSDDWLKARKDDYAVLTPHELSESGWLKYLLTYTDNILRGCACELDNAIKICEEPDGPYMYAELLEKELQMLFNLIDSAENIFQNYQAGFAKLSFARLPVKKDDSVSADKREQAKALRNMVKDAVKDTAEFFRQPLETIFARMSEISPPIATLIDLTCDYKKRFDQAKREKNIIDFSDMEHFALDILWEKTEGGLIPSKAAKELKHHFVSVMTDEYQDSNQVQELLLQSISSEDEGRYNRFMVGDVKQSIYKFRLARPEIFMEKYENYPLTACDNENRLRIDLNQNFRSRLNVLDAVNYLFAKIMQKSLGGIEYDRQAALYHGAEYPDNGDENQTELLLLNLSEENEEEDAVAEDFITDSNKELEAAMIARRIKEMVGKFKVTDKESKLLRPICYRDIVILLRTTKEWDEVFKKVLGKEGIPAITSARTGYFAAAEIQTILHVVGILNNPHQDIPLFGVMKSFFGGFADEEIAIIKARGDKREGLYDKLLNFVCTDEIDEKLSEKISKFKNFIEINRRKAIYTPIFALLNELIMGSGYYYDALVRPDGERRAANLEMLLKKASSFAGTGYHGLFHFVRYIEQLEKYDVDYGEANVLDEQADIVRLMSIHKSKGLEFPVCFVAGLSKPINMMNARGTLCLDIDLGLGVDYIDNKLRVKKKTLKKSVVSQKIKLDSLGEELRILYVAMTRAKEKLILTGTTKKLPPVGCDSQSRPSFLKLISTRSFLDLIISPAMSTEADGIIATRIFSKKDLASATINEIVDLSRRRELLLTALEYDRHCGHDPQSADLAISKSNYIKEKVTEMSEKFKRPYPHANLASLYAKTTVSELKKADTIAGVINIDQNSVADIYNQDLFELPEVVPYIPQFMKEEMPNKNISGGSERGSAYHKVMEFIKFKELNHRAELYAASFSADNLELNITRQLEAALQNSRISPEYKDAVPMDKILAFFITKKNNALSLSSLSARMIAADQADQLYKEQPFVIGLPADRLNPDLPNEETILIQGIIDAFFIEADGIVVLDYKSDAVKTADELISRYQKQLDYYGEALEQLTGKSVKEKIIYSFALEEAVYL